MGARRLLPLCLFVLLLSVCTSLEAQGPAFRQLIRDGQRLSSVGNLRSASAKYNAAMDAAANDQELAEALVAHAIAQRSLHRDDQAESDLRRAVALPEAGVFRRPAMFQLASLLEEQHRLDEALKLYREVAARLRDRPGEAGEVLLAAARLLVDGGEMQRAREVLGEIRVDALAPQLRTELAGLQLEVYIGSGDLEAAKAAIEGSGAQAAQLAQLYVRLARVLLSRNRLDEAVQAAQAAVQADPGSQSAWRTQYDIAAAQGTMDRLRSEAEAALKADPQNDLLFQRLASYAEWDSDPDQALAIFGRLLELRPNDANLLERAGALAAQAGRAQEAIEFYEAALKLQPNDSGLCYMLAGAYAKAGKRAEAVEMLRKGTQFRPGDLDSARRLGMLLVRNAMYDEAVKVYEDARKLTGDPNALAYEMAEALAPVRPEDALREYVRVASASIDEADTVAPDAVKLAHDADLLPKLAELTEAALHEAKAPGVALLLALVRAAQGDASAGVKQAVELGLSPDDLMLIAEALEAQGHRDAAAQAYAAVAENPDTPPGLRLELGVRAAEAQIAAGQREEARTALQAALEGASGPQPLTDRASFLLADLDLAAGRNLQHAGETFARVAQRSAEPDLSRKAIWRVADVVFAQGDYDQAERLYAQLAAQPPELEVPPPPAPPGFGAGGRGLPVPVFALFDEQPQADPRTTPAYAASQIAECAFRKGDLDRAKALFAEVAEKYPDSVYANDAVERRLLIATHFSNPRPATEAYLSALTEALGDDWEAAIEKLRGITDAGLTEPLADDAALLIGSILETHGKLAEAADEYRALPQRFPGSLLIPEALLNAARLARSLGDDAQAKEDLGAILQNSPSAPMAKTAALWLDDLEQGRPWPTP
jgi:tetratricopeptide (TPR) repeat protein